ncbi:hypothetical protein OPV22_007016 [Ensete ventricosum]|uniref:DUF4378 domain-containing protein n=1 Tax=Ensete ventricosum TaxID=4639 RepID=A0AAV8RU76_ENSVE|nr:hypothetical protein OPV22_007016 [Ensete ventricosum]
MLLSSRSVRPQILSSSVPTSLAVFALLHAEQELRKSPRHMNGRMLPSPISSSVATLGASTPVTGGNGAVPISQLKQGASDHDGFTSLSKYTNGYRPIGTIHHRLKLNFSPEVWQDVARTLSARSLVLGDHKTLGLLQLLTVQMLLKLVSQIMVLFWRSKQWTSFCLAFRWNWSKKELSAFGNSNSSHSKTSAVAEEKRSLNWKLSLLLLDLLVVLFFPIRARLISGKVCSKLKPDMLSNYEGKCEDANVSLVTNMESSYEVGAVAKDKDSEINPEEDGINIRRDMSALKPGSLIYQEAKKHLTEMPDTGDQRACLPTAAHVPESLGSHGSDKEELVLPYEETGSLPVQQFHQEDATSSLSLLNQSLELSPHSSGDQTDAPMLDSEAEITGNHMQEGFCMGSELKLEGAQQARFNFIKAVIEASGLSAIDFSGRCCHLGDELLARSLFDEVEISSSPQKDDPKLLFDCINEALEEICKRRPWVSLNTSNVQQAPVAQSLIREVSRRIERQISMHSSNSLGQMVTRDLERVSLLELHSETKNIVDEIWDTLLDDLVDETIFDLWLDLSAGL